MLVWMALKSMSDGADLYKELDEHEIDVSADTEMSAAEKASIMLVAGDAPKSSTEAFWNASAMEEM